VPATPELLAPQRLAVRRWKRGHHAFHVVIVAMNTRLRETGAGVAAGDWDVVAAAMRDLAGLYDAATAIMRYTGGFQRTEYETLIRPSMMPPLVSPGFSGVFNREHAHLLRTFGELRTVMRRALARDDHPVPPPAEAAWAALRAAQRANLAAHMLVCRRFVDDGMSLLADFHRRRDAGR
jgi:hypothetical protein